jgi:ferric-dicitrate binding protein FerR (iron transport regulator)
MQDAQTWMMLSKHLAGEETGEENALFQSWLSTNENNKAFFQRMKLLWDNPSGSAIAAPTLTLRQKFSGKGIKNYVVKLALGNFVGFVIGMWVTSLFSHYVLERKSIKNLFGLAKRKQVEVNTIPEWLQGLLVIIIGFIVMELINHFFQSKKHLMLWDMIRGKKE